MLIYFYMNIKVLSNKKRLGLIVCLANPHNVTQLLKVCDLSQSALSQHLALLKQEEIVDCVRVGNQQIYHLKNKKILSIAKALLQLENN